MLSGYAIDRKCNESMFCCVFPRTQPVIISRAQKTPPPQPLVKQFHEGSLAPRGRIASVQRFLKMRCNNGVLLPTDYTAESCVKIQAFLSLSHSFPPQSMHSMRPRAHLLFGFRSPAVKPILTLALWLHCGTCSWPSSNCFHSRSES